MSADQTERKITALYERLSRDDVLFREKGVRFIAIANGVDSADKASGEFTPFLNIMNEWYLRDCSRKQVAVFQIRTGSAEHITGRNPAAVPCGKSRDRRLRQYDES